MATSLEPAETGIQSELGSSEVLLWAGRPRQGFARRGSDAVLLPMAAICFFGSIMEMNWLMAADSWSEVPWIFALFLLSVYLIIYRFCLDPWIRGKTLY